jgi:hypothetical protein
VLPDPPRIWDDSALVPTASPTPMPLDRDPSSLDSGSSVVRPSRSTDRIRTFATIVPVTLILVLAGCSSQTPGERFQEAIAKDSYLSGMDINVAHDAARDICALMDEGYKLFDIRTLYTTGGIDDRGITHLFHATSKFCPEHTNVLLGTKAG